MAATRHRSNSARRSVWIMSRAAHIASRWRALRQPRQRSAARATAPRNLRGRYSLLLGRRDMLGISPATGWTAMAYVTIGRWGKNLAIRLPGEVGGAERR